MAKTPPSSTWYRVTAPLLLPTSSKSKMRRPAPGMRRSLTLIAVRSCPCPTLWPMHRCVCIHCLCLRVFIVYIQYTVVPTTKHSFADGLETLVDPADLTSSPLGWHDAGFGNSTSTSYVANIVFDWLVLTLLSGNNVLAFKGQSVTAQTTSGLNFNDKYDDTLDPTDATNLNAARVNGFYILNVMHDFSYRYGFTEDKFNFQLNNFDNAGQENDRVLLSIQDPSGTDNANFATPPEYVCSPSG